MPLFIPLLNYLMKPDISMRNFYLFVFLFASINLFGQNTRYLDDVFNSVNKTTLEYSSVYGLDMDVYEPVGDSETNRPLIILAHGGSFDAGSKENPTMVTLCESFARKGYVTASIQYRLGNVFDMLDSLSMINVVMKALSDAKSAVRYFRMDAAGANSFNINSNMIFWKYCYFPSYKILSISRSFTYHAVKVSVTCFCNYFWILSFQ